MPKRSREEQDSDSEVSVLDVGYHLPAAVPDTLTHSHTHGHALTHAHTQHTQHTQHSMLSHPYTVSLSASPAVSLSVSVPSAAASASVGAAPSALSTAEELQHWQPVNNANDHFHAVLPLHGLDAELDLPLDASLVHIFTRFLPGDLLVRVFESYPAEHWSYSSGTAHGKVMQGKANLRAIYQYFAVYIRSIALLENQSSSNSNSNSNGNAMSSANAMNSSSSSSAAAMNNNNINSNTNAVNEGETESNNEDNTNANSNGMNSGNNALSLGAEAVKVVRKRGRPPLHRVVEIETHTHTQQTHILTQAFAQAAAPHNALSQGAQQAIVPAVNGSHTHTPLSHISHNLAAVDAAASSPIPLTQSHTQTHTQKQSSASAAANNKRPLRSCIKECIDHFVLRLALHHSQAHNANSSSSGNGNGTGSGSSSAEGESVDAPLNTNNNPSTPSTTTVLSLPRGERAMPGYDMLEKFWSRFHIREPFYAEILTHFQAVVRTAGDYLVCNEHLLYFQGHSNTLLFNSNKASEKHGLYFFSAHCVLRDPFRRTHTHTQHALAHAHAHSQTHSALSHNNHMYLSQQAHSMHSQPPSSSSHMPYTHSHTSQHASHSQHAQHTRYNSFLLHAKLFYANPKQGRLPNTHEQLLVWLSLFQRYRDAALTHTQQTHTLTQSLSQEHSLAQAHTQTHTQEYAHAHTRTHPLKLLLPQSSVCEEEVESLLRTHAVPHLTVAQVNRFPTLLSVLSHRCGKLRQRGDVCGVFNERERELCVAYWDADSLVGKRNYVSNLFEKNNNINNNNNNNNNNTNNNNDMGSGNINENAMMNVNMNVNMNMGVNNSVSGMNMNAVNAMGGVSVSDMMNNGAAASAAMVNATLPSQPQAYAHSLHHSQQVHSQAHTQPHNSHSQLQNASVGPAKLEDLNAHVSSLLRGYGNVFAEEMQDRKICHKTGGKSKLGQDGQEHKLIMGCVLHNTFAAYVHIRLSNGNAAEMAAPPSFSDLCAQLADELFDYALGLN